MEYGRIIKRAWDITWHHKVLWIFGIALALFSGNWGSNLIFQNHADIQRWRNMPWRFPMPHGSRDFYGPFLPNPGAIAAVLGLLALFGLIWFIVGILVRNTSLGAMIHVTDQVEEEGDASFRSGFKRGWARFLRLFGINVVLAIAGIIIAIMISILVILGLIIVIAPTVALVRGEGIAVALGIIWAIGSGLILLLLLIAAAVALGLLFTLVGEFAYRYAILENKGVFESIGAGYTLMRDNLHQAGLIWLITLAISLAMSIILVPLVVAGVIAITLLVGIGMTGKGAPLLSLAIGLPLLLVFAVIVIFVTGIYTALSSSIWTLTFRELREISAPAAPVPIEPAPTESA